MPKLHNSIWDWDCIFTWLTTPCQPVINTVFIIGFVLMCFSLLAWICYWNKNFSLRSSYYHGSEPTEYYRSILDVKTASFAIRAKGIYFGCKLHLYNNYLKKNKKNPSKNTNLTNHVRLATPSRDTCIRVAKLETTICPLTKI